ISWRKRRRIWSVALFTMEVVRGQTLGREVTLALVSEALHQLNPHAVRALDEREAHGRPAWERQRPRLGCHFDVLRLQPGDDTVDIQRPESNMVDGMALTGRRLPALRENPNAAVVDPVNPIFQLAYRSTELVYVPRQRGGRIRCTQVDVMQAEL